MLALQVTSFVCPVWMPLCVLFLVIVFYPGAIIPCFKHLLTGINPKTILLQCSTFLNNKHASCDFASSSWQVSLDELLTDNLPWCICV